MTHPAALLPVRLACIALALLALAAPAASARGAAEYWATSDEFVATVDTAWDDAAGVYHTPGAPPGTRLNSTMLLVHALAAQAGHEGLARQDSRAVRLVRRMVSAPAFDDRLNPAQAHAPGWGASLEDASFQQHVAIDARVEEALAAAYVAGGTIGLNSTDRARIRDRLCRVASSPLYAQPQLNQINWMADVYAACATAGGDTKLLRNAYRHWLVWFLDHARRPAAGRKTSNLNAGFGLHYLPQRKTASALNQLPTTEYNSIIVTALRPYDDAVARGMKPLGRRLLGVARRWQGRVLYGEWTSAGYPNWDTGLGFARWHMRRYWAWSTDGLLAIAQGRAIGLSAPARAHAEATFDAALDLYSRVHRVEAGPEESPMSFGLPYPEAQEQVDWLLVPARFAALAARAAVDGFGGVAPKTLPQSYGYDPDIHRLTIATPRYSTAIVPPSRVGNGGAELSRLYDASGFPVSGTGGSGASRTGFGIRVFAGLRALLETQPGAGSSRGAGLISFRAASGGGTFTGSRVARSRVIGHDGAKATVTHRFGATSITVYHRLRGLGHRRLVAKVRFPAYGVADYALVGAGGVMTPVGSQPIAVSGRVAFRVTLRDGRGYDVALLTALPAGTAVHVAATTRSRSAPLTRSALLVELPLHGEGADIGYRLTPFPFSPGPAP